MLDTIDVTCTCCSAVCCFLVLTPSWDDQLLPPMSNGAAPAWAVSKRCNAAIVLDPHYGVHVHVHAVAACKPTHQ